MVRELILLRHAKSDWNKDSSDFDRPLNARGQRDAERLADWFRQQRTQPDILLSSPARRAAQTTKALCRPGGIPGKHVHWEERLYLAPLSTLLTLITEQPAGARCLMIVGHNPGLEDLLLHLAGNAEQHMHNDKLLTTATLARLRLPKDWKHLDHHCARLEQFVRPRDLPDA